MSLRITSRADYQAAWATGIGIGAGSFMVIWLVANRVTAMTMSVPAGPMLAMTLAIASGLVVSVVAGRHLSRRFLSE